MTDIVIKLEQWEKDMLDAYFLNIEEEVQNELNFKINAYKNTCVDLYVNYCKKNNLPISYKNDEELISKLYDLKLLVNLNQLNKFFIENN